MKTDLDKYKVSSTAYIVEEVQKNLLGKGVYAYVYSGSYLTKSVAIKIGNIMYADSFVNEIENLKKIADACEQNEEQAVNIVKFYGYDKPSFSRNIMLFELMNKGTLATWISSVISPDYKQCRLFMLSIASGLDFLHKKVNIVHCDLKLENIFLTLNEEGILQAKIGDYGLSLDFDLAECTGLNRGTHQYAAPELLAGTAGCTSASDIYSFGVVAYASISLKEPYVGIPVWQIKKRVVDEKLRLELPSNCEPKLAALVKRCWEENPTKRPEASEVVQELKVMSSYS